MYATNCPIQCYKAVCIFVYICTYIYNIWKERDMKKRKVAGYSARNEMEKIFQVWIIRDK